MNTQTFLKKSLLIDHYFTETWHKNLQINALWRKDESNQQLFRLYKIERFFVLVELKLGQFIYAKRRSVIAFRIYLH